MRLLLDTCTFLWAAWGDAQLSEAARKAISDDASEVFLSAASAWEIAVKHGLGRLPLPAGPDVFVPDIRDRLAITALPIEEASILQIVRLPALHRDPFDRMLVCQAIHHGLVLVTPDEAIRQYPLRTLW